MYRHAYRLPGVSPRVAKESEVFRRLRVQCPDGEDGVWVCFDHPDGGTLAVWPGSPASPPNLDDFGDPRPTDDGLTYYPSREQPDLSDLLRPLTSRPLDGSWVTLSNGSELWVSVAVLSDVRFAMLASGGRKPVSAKHAYGILAREYEELCSRKDPEAPESDIMSCAVRLAVAAIQISYAVTDESITDIEAFHLSTRDLMAIVYHARGLDPKGCAAALASLLDSSPAAESQPCRSDLLNPSPSLGGRSAPVAHHGSS